MDGCLCCLCYLGSARLFFYVLVVVLGPWACDIGSIPVEYPWDLTLELLVRWHVNFDGKVILAGWGG